MNTFPVALILSALQAVLTRSWKTSLAGLVAGVIAVKPELDAYLDGKPVDWRMVGIGFAVAAAGYFARDKNVSSEQQAGVKP
jgi:hypothetical protein